MARTDIQMNIRLPANMKAQIEAAAQESGRSVTAEIVARLERSFPLSINEQILELRRAEVAELRAWLERASALSQELKDRLASESLPSDRRGSVEATLEKAAPEIARARAALAVAEARLEQAIQDEADWMERTFHTQKTPH
ncbi:Arc family DNA-binding protein [Rhodanobacter denitrificans]|nr:Arc family DNA-binding protein [Rhodanobacter denitrificans]